LLATFDLTSLSLLKHWNWPVAVVDVSWGSFVTAVSSTAGLLIANWPAPKVQPSLRGVRAAKQSRNLDCFVRNDGDRRYFGCGTIRR
jgi:hypothetical protein